MIDATHAAHVEDAVDAVGPSDSKKSLACRIGYAAHGVVYLLVGLLAIDAALGAGGQAVGQRGAIAEFGDGMLGTVFLTLLALGLAAYSFLRFWQGIGNPANHDDDVEGIGLRIGRVGSGLTHAALAMYALSIAFGWFTGGAGSAGGASGLTARVMGMPGGRWIIGAIGAGICVAAFVQLAKAVTASFLNHLAISGDKEQWVRPLGRIGYAARFVVFLIAGGFLVTAAVQAQPGEAKGLGGALRTLQDQAYGPWLLGIVAGGLIAFAVLRGVYARYAILPDRRDESD